MATVSQVDIKKLYDEEIAAGFDKNYFDLLGQSHTIALNQIAGTFSLSRGNQILELAVATGEFLYKLKTLFPEATFFGIDLSQRMLDLAQKKMQFFSFCDDALNMGQHLPPESMDLISMHYLLGYIEPKKIFSESLRILKKGGYFSVITGTSQSFKKISTLGESFFSSGQFRRLTYVPDSSEQLISFLEECDFKVEKIEPLQKTLRFSHFDEFYDFGMRTGWFAHFLSSLKMEDLQKIKIFTKQFFPIEDQSDIWIVLAKKL